MKRAAKVFGGWVVAVAAFAANSQALAPREQAAAAGELAALDAQQVADWVGWLSAVFELPADLPIDAGLRSDASALAHAHLARMRGVLAQWVAEARLASASSAPVWPAERHMQVRFVNELAWWRLDSAGAEADTAMLPALLAPERCRIAERFRLFARQMLIVQQSPAGQRAMLLAAERELLDRWGAQRGQVPERPVPSLAEQVNRDVAKMTNSDWLPAIPMPPVLASHLLVREREPATAALTCLMAQWGLRMRVAEGADQVAKALTAWRYGTMPEAAQWLASPDRLKGKTPVDYPPFAQQYGVEGVVNVAVMVDAQGRPTDTRIVSRTVTVMGLRDVRAVAFETSLDDASIARVRLPDMVARFQALAAKRTEPGLSIVVPVKWNLE